MKQWIRDAYRCQPLWLRRRELRLIARLLACKLDPQRPLPPGDVVMAGFHGTTVGMGEGAREMLRRFLAAGIDAHAANISQFAALDDLEAGPLWPAAAAACGLAIFHVNPDLFELTALAVGRHRLRQRRMIGYWTWELETIPHAWLRTLNAVDEIWAPSRFIADAFRKSAPGKPVYIVPQPLDAAAMPTAPRRDPLPQFHGCPTVLFAYDVRSTHARKNPEAAIEAFRRATAGDPNPVLVIKINNGHAWPESPARIMRAINGMPNVHVMHDKLTRDGMQDLIARAAIVVSLHRAEGFGLLMAEGMAAAKPVIATGWSGNLDFMPGDCAVLVDYKMVPVIDDQHVYDKPGALWAEPDIDQAAAALRRLLADPAERHRLGAKARAHMLDFTSPARWFKSLPPAFWQSLKDASAKARALEISKAA